MLAATAGLALALGISFGISGWVEKMLQLHTRIVERTMLKEKLAWRR